MSERDTNKHLTNSYHFWNWSKEVYIDIYEYLCTYLYFNIKSALPYFQELPNINVFYWRSAIFLAFCASSNPVIKFIVDPLFLCTCFKILQEIILQCSHPCSQQFSSILLFAHWNSFANWDPLASGGGIIVFFYA